MMDYTISLAALFWMASGLAAIIGIYKICKRPFNQLDDHERRLHRLEDDRLERQKTNTLILRSLNAITNHMIDGNGISDLKRVRDDLQNSIIEGHK